MVEECYIVQYSCNIWIGKGYDYADISKSEIQKVNSRFDEKSLRNDCKEMQFEIDWISSSKVKFIAEISNLMKNDDGRKYREVDFKCLISVVKHLSDDAEKKWIDFMQKRGDDYTNLFRGFFNENIECFPVEDLKSEEIEKIREFWGKENEDISIRVQKIDSVRLLTPY